MKSYDAYQHFFLYFFVDLIQLSEGECPGSKSVRLQ